MVRELSCKFSVSVMDKLLSGRILLYFFNARGPAVIAFTD